MSSSTRIEIVDGPSIFGICECLAATINPNTQSKFTMILVFPDGKREVVINIDQVSEMTGGQGMLVKIMGYFMIPGRKVNFGGLYEAKTRRGFIEV